MLSVWLRGKDVKDGRNELWLRKGINLGIQNPKYSKLVEP